MSLSERQKALIPLTEEWEQELFKQVADLMTAARQAGREAGFAEALREAAFFVSDNFVEGDTSGDWLAAQIAKLKCPPAADGSEGSDGDK